MRIAVVGGPAPAPSDVDELRQLLLRGHQLAGRLMGSRAEIREEDAQVLAEAYAGVGSALDVLLPPLRLAARIENTFQRLEGMRIRRRTAGEDQRAGVP